MNNGRNVNNMTNVHGMNNNAHGMNRQQQRPNPHHFNQQQANPHHRAPGSHPQPRPAGANPQQQRHSQNPNMQQRSANQQGMNRQQRPPGHQSSSGNPNNPHRAQQQQRPAGAHGNMQRPSNPNMRQGQPGAPGQQQRPNSQNSQRGPNQQRPNAPGATNGAPNGPPAGPPLPNVLPKGWKKKEVMRTKGISSGIVDVIYIPSASATDLPAGKKFKSKLELHRYFGNRYDMSLLDYRSGKLSQVNWRKQRRMKSLAMNNTNYASAAKYDNYMNLPIRQTASIFKQSVTYHTNNHKNEPTPANILNPPTNKAAEKPKPTQLFWELRFNKLKPVDSRVLADENGNELNQEIDLKNIPKFKNFTVTNESVLRSVAASWYINQSKPLVGQDKEFAKNARIFIDREQPLIPQTNVKESEIKLQEQKLKDLRKKLQSTLKELEHMDFMSLDEIELAEQELVEQIKQTSENLAPEVKKDEQDELIVL